MDISVWIQGFNEEPVLPRLFKSLKDFKDIVFIDHESTDNTAVLAKKLGARVYTIPYPKDRVKRQDITDFIDRFGYKPLFKVGEMVPIAWKARTEGQAYCKNDWVLNIDCDEVLTIDYEKVKAILPQYDFINCKYYHDRKPDGSRADTWVQTGKLYNRKKVFWIGRIHEVLNGYNIKVGWTDDMEVDHLQILSRDRSSNVRVMEYAVLRDQDIRSFFYLGKEYHHWEQWTFAINTLTLYLKEAWYKAEMVKAYGMIADSLWHLGRVDEAWVYATQGLKINPKSQELYQLLAKIAPKEHEGEWLKHAEIAENDHLL